MVSIASSPDGPLTSASARFPVGDVGGEVGHLVLGDVGRVRHHHLEPAAQLAGQGREPGTGLQTDPDGRRPGSRQVGARDRERILAHVGGPHLRVGELARHDQSDRTGSGAEIGDRAGGRTGAPRVVRAPSRAEPHRFVDRGLRHDLGLRPGHQHASVDEEVEAEEVPPAQHVLQRFTAGAAFEHVVEVLDAGRGRRFVLRHHQFDAFVPRHPFDHPPGLGVGSQRGGRPQPRLRLHPQVGPGRHCSSSTS